MFPKEQEDVKKHASSGLVSRDCTHPNPQERGLQNETLSTLAQENRVLRETITSLQKQLEGKVHECETWKKRAFAEISNETKILHAEFPTEATEQDFIVSRKKKEKKRVRKVSAPRSPEEKTSGTQVDTLVLPLSSEMTTESENAPFERSLNPAFAKADRSSEEMLLQSSIDSLQKSLRGSIEVRKFLLVLKF